MKARLLQLPLALLLAFGAATGAHAQSGGKRVDPTKPYDPDAPPFNPAESAKPTR